MPSRQRFWLWDRAGYPARVERRRQEAIEVCGKIGAKVAHFSDVTARDLRNRVGAARDLILSHSVACGADMLWVPAYEGGHPDHDIANFIASTLRDGPPVWEYCEYNFCGGLVRSNEFLAPTGQEMELKLSEDERRFKRMLLAMYVSERGNLSYLRTEREAFRPLADYDYLRPPHEGTLFYRRFAWASFHPRVNHVRPADVCRAIKDFRVAQS